MTTISWNCRGLGAQIKRAQVRKLIHTHNPSFTFIQETKIENLNPKLIRSIWSGDDIRWCASPSIGNSGGFLSLWKNSFFILTSSRIERNWIVLCGSIPSLEFQCAIFNIYNPCSIEDRAVVWRDLIESWHEIKLPSMFIGDFNEILNPSERGSQLISQEGSNDFHNFLQHVEVLEISPPNGPYTWFHNNRKSKLDRCFVNTEWISKFPLLSTTLLNRTISDHCPILAQTTNPIDGPKPFRFLNCWTSHPNFLPIIRKAWLENPLLSIPDKLKLVKKNSKNGTKTSSDQLMKI